MNTSGRERSLRSNYRDAPDRLSQIEGSPDLSFAASESPLGLTASGPGRVQGQ